ncbi:MAG: hypothetical protein COA49_01860 [Bacteroidetes bacterium]|nr:MAG: hypothetical protein COA49_01860 [Bacteroidota bacterium]
MSFLRNIVSVIIGIAVGGLVVFLIERSGHEMFSVYSNVPDIGEKEAFSTFVGNLPIKAFLLLLLAHSLGTVIAAFIATLLSGLSRPIPAITIGVLMLSAGVINLISIPHPVWYQISEIILYFPAALLGYKLSIETRRKITSLK